MRSIWLLMTVGSASGMYCGQEDCYQVLGLDRYDNPSAQEIKKVYRTLSKDLHPDRETGDADKFSRVATAYEVLSEPKTKDAYEYYLDHPSEHMMNQYNFYTATYSPKSDWRSVVLAVLFVISALQWVLQTLMHKQAVDSFVKNDPKFQKEVKRVARERMPASIKKNNKSQVGAMEKFVAVELATSIDIQGGYKKPELHDLLVIKLVKLPVTIPRLLYFNILWWYKHSILEQPYSLEEKILLMEQTMGRSWESLDQDFNESEKQELLDKECWIRDNFKSFEELQFKKKYPERYKQYLRYKRKNL